MVRVFPPTTSGGVALIDEPFIVLGQWLKLTCVVCAVRQGWLHPNGRCFRAWPDHQFLRFCSGEPIAEESFIQNPNESYDCMKKSIAVSPNIETFFGTRDENVRLLEDGLNITINLRSNGIELEGAAKDVAMLGLTAMLFFMQS